MKLALGTVQFGIDYGINNKRGKVPKEEVKEILKLAYEKGIEILDTANAYGESEKVLGEIGGDFKIVTKVDSPEVVENFKKSMDNLKKIYGYMIHNFEIFLDTPSMWEDMVKLKEEEKVEKIGFSLYKPEEVDILFEKGIDFDIVQVPYSIFDQRFAEKIKEMKSKGVEVYVRSVFLQGLFFKNPEELNGIFESIVKKVISLRKIADQENIPLSSLCIGFALLNDDIDKVVLGVDSIENLKDNLEVLDHLDNVKKVYEDLKLFKEDNEQIILPVNWKNE